MRITIIWGLCWGSLVVGDYHIDEATAERPSLCLARRLNTLGMV